MDCWRRTHNNIAQNVCSALLVSYHRKMKNKKIVRTKTRKIEMNIFRLSFHLEFSSCARFSTFSWILDLHLNVCQRMLYVIFCFNAVLEFLLFSVYSFAKWFLFTSMQISNSVSTSFSQRITISGFFPTFCWCLYFLNMDLLSFAGYKTLLFLIFFSPFC